MNDLYKFNPLANACRLGEIILNHFSNVEEEQKLLDVQKANGVLRPLKLVKPVITRFSSFLQVEICIFCDIFFRWNTVCDAHERMIALKPYISVVTPIPTTDWAEMELGLKAIKVVAVATDRVQADTASLATVKSEMSKIREHFEKV